LLISGLRLSQFNKDMVGAPSETRQKTLTDFLISGDANRKSTSDNSSLGSIVDSHEICSYEGREGRDLLDGSDLPDLEGNHTISSNAGGMEKIYEPLKNETANEVCENFEDWS
jgi:hypothetical protein